jgi:subtilisin family serine protease/Tol biopolymer transport system component
MANVRIRTFVMQSNFSLRVGVCLALLCSGLLRPAAAVPDPATYLPGQLVVKFKPTSSGATPQSLALPAGTRVRSTLPILGWQVLQLPPGIEVATALDYYRRLPNVAFAEPNFRIRLFATPNDPRREALWGLDRINAAQAWDQSTGDADIVVATIDTGIDYDHPDLAANVWTNPGEIPGNNVDDDQNGYIDDVHGINTLNHSGDVRDDDGHGTHVAGTIGAVGNNGLGVVGVNWRVQLVSVKIFSADDSAGTAGAAEGYEYLMALKRRGVNIRVANNSWGGPVPSQVLYEAMCAAEEAGILSVCAAGNSNHNTDERPDFPAGLDCASLISVAASTSDDEPASFSNYGALTVDLAAPGESVLSTYRGAGHYQSLSGTSMASPHVAGAAALLLARNSSLSPATLKALLIATVDPLPQWQGRVVSGGRLNVGNAMARLISGSLPNPAPETNELALPLPRITAVSRNTQGRMGSGSSFSPAMSTNGQFVSFLSAATNLDANAGGTHDLVYVQDRATRSTTLVSRSSTGALPNAACTDVRISGNGRFVVFVSAASNVMANDTNGRSDVFLYDRTSNQLELISRTASGVGNDASDSPAISDDGRYVVFASDASNLISGDNNISRDIFLRDRQLGVTTRVSVSSLGAQADYDSDLPNISGDGRYITFLSGADNLVSDTYFAAYHLYLRDRVGSTTERISKTSSGEPGNGNGGLSSLSADGRYIAFESNASNLVGADTNNSQDIFLWDRVLRVMQRISVANTGAQADQDCWAPFITSNGRHVFFFSDAVTLCAQDDDAVHEVFGYDRLTAKLSRLAYNHAGHTGLDGSFFSTASVDGQYVAFDAWAWNLVPGDGNGALDVLLMDRGESIPDLMIYAAGDTDRQGMGLHGMNIVQRRELPLTNGLATFYIRLDNDGPESEVFSVRANAAPAGWEARFFLDTADITTAMTGAGSTISLPAAGNAVLRLEVASPNAAMGESWAEWLITAIGTRTNSGLDAVRAVVTRTPSPPAFQIVSRAADGRPGNDASGPANVSADARFVTFTSTASDLTSHDYNLQEDVFVLDRQAGALECLSKQAGGETGNGRSYNPRISRDGRYVVFQSSATNLIAGDTNDREDVFLFDRQSRAMSRVSIGPAGDQSSRDSGLSRISGDGRYAAFESLAENFVPGDVNGTWDIFLRDNLDGTIQCLSLAGSQTANDESHSPVMSNDGSLVVFSSLASNLAPGDTNEVNDLFLWQRGVSGVRLLSHTADGRAANEESDTPSISDDNRYILFSSAATDLAVSNFDISSVTFLYDRETGQLSQINPPRVAGRQRGGFFGARLAPDGRLITLLADLADSSGGSNYVTGVLLYDRLTGTTTELSRKRDGTPGTDHTVGAAVSADGRYITMASRASNLIGETTSGADQVLLYDRASFQPDEWIRRDSSAPYRGQGVLTESVQRVEPTVKPGFTVVFFVTVRNYGTVADRYVFQAPSNVTGGIDARYFLEPAGTEITAAVTNAGWSSDLVSVGDTRELRIQIIASNSQLFNQDLVFASASLSDPSKVDEVRVRLLRDDDNDGLPDSWEQQYFGNPTSAVASDDSDGDGFSNLAEYIAGTDPTSADPIDSAAYLRITQIQAGAGPSLTITWPSVTNRIYTVERASNEPAGFARVVDVFGDPVETSYRDIWQTNPPPAFYRIRAELP